MLRYFYVFIYIDMEKLTIIFVGIFTLICQSYAVDPDPVQSTDGPNTAYLHSHLYCPFSVEASPDVFLGDFVIGKDQDVFDSEILFEIRGQAFNNPSDELLDDYEKGFFTQTGQVYNQAMGAGPEIYSDEVFNYKRPEYHVEFQGETVQQSLGSAGGQVILDLEWAMYDPVNDDWISPENYIELNPRGTASCNGFATFRVKALRLRFAGDVDPGPYTFRQTVTVEMVLI